MPHEEPKPVAQKLEDLFLRTRRLSPFVRLKAIHLLICLLIIVFHIALLSSGALKRVEYLFLDSFFRQRPVQVTHPDIALILIDERSMQAIGSWPWPWHYHAQMIHILNEWGAKAIVFDMLFEESKTPYEDAALEEILQHADQVYFPVSLEAKTGKTIWVHSLPVVLEPENDAKVWTHPLAGIETYARGLGHINTELDKDGVLRRVRPYLKYGDEQYPHLALRVALDLLSEGLPKPTNVELPLDAEGRFLVNWAGKWKKAFNRYSFSDVIRSFHSIAQGIDPTIPPAEIQGKICLIGVTAKGFGNMNVIPLQSNYPDLGVLANFLNDILTEKYVVAASLLQNVICLFVIGLLASVLFVYFRNVPSFVAGLALGGLWILIAFFLFWREGIWFFVLHPLLAILSIFVFSAFYDHIMGKRERTHLYDLATRDGLTGLFVIRHFREVLNQVVKESQRKKEPLSLILIDIDNFKPVNDTYGHQAGDMVLKRTAELIYTCFRTKRPIHEADFVARYGGEEFIVMLRNAKLMDAASKVAERIRKKVDHEIFIWEGQVIPVKISLGVATLHPGEVIPDFMVRRADEALYEAKRTGKNRVCLEKSSSS